MTATDDGDTPTIEPAKKDVIRIKTDLNPRMILLPAVGAATGLFVGFIRGSREAGLQFLAENAHRPPKTVRGWYFYNKTKNYRMIWNGMKVGGRNAAKIGSVGLLWAGIEECVSRYGQSIEQFKETVAGFGTGAVFSAVTRPGRVNSWRAIVLGTLVGGVMSGLRMGQDKIGTRIKGSTSGGD